MEDKRDGGIDISGGRTQVGRDNIGGNVNYNYGNTSVPQRPRSSIPHQPYFFGRKEELGKIKDALSPETRSWGALIDGPGGIGKTALAIQAAIEADDKQFPIKIFLSSKVRQLTPQGEQPLEDFQLPNFIALISEIAHELGDEAIEKVPENERANAVRRLLADKNALIVIDNLETFDERERMRLYQFLQRLPEGSKAIVTSRRRTDIDARVVRLDRLDWAAARELIGELATKNHHLARESEQEGRRLYEITNGNPLLIKWLVGQLGREKSQARTIAEAVTFIENAPKGNDPLEYIFGDLLDTFTESETAVLAALSYFTRPAKLKWVADIAGLAEPVARTALEDLTDRALVITAENAQTYFLPPLAASFIRRKRPEVIKQSAERFTDRAYALILENGYREYERFPALEAEWDTIALAIALFLKGENQRLQRVCTALKSFLEFTGRWDEWLALEMQGEERAVAEKDFDKAGWRAYQAGWVYYSRGQAAEVLACAQRAEAHWTENGAHEKAAALRLRGMGHELEKNYAAAKEAYQEALALHRTLGQEGRDVSNFLNDLGLVEQALNEYDAAERDLRESLRISKKIDDRDGVAASIGTLAQLALAREDWQNGETLAQEALRLAEGLGSQETIALDNFRIARALVRQGRARERPALSATSRRNFHKAAIQSFRRSTRNLRECEESTKTSKPSQ